MQTSERIRPGFVLFHGNITIFAEHISEITKCITLANLVSFVRRIGDALYLPEITKLIKNLCFGVTHLVEIPLTLIEYTILGAVPQLCDTLPTGPPHHALVLFSLIIGVQIVGGKNIIPITFVIIDVRVFLHNLIRSRGQLGSIFGV